METLVIFLILSGVAYFVVSSQRPEWIELIKSKLKKK